MNLPVLKYNLDISENSDWITVTASQTARSGFLYVQELGNFCCGPNYFTYRSGLKSYQIILSLEGKGYLKYRGKEYEVSPGKLLFLDCMEEQLYSTHPSSDSWHTLWVHMHGANAEAYHQLFDQINENSPIVSIGGDVSVKSLLDMLMNLYAKQGSTLHEDILAASLLNQLLTKCIQSIENLNGTRLPRYVEEIRSFIELHYKEKITLDSLSSALSINKFYLQKLFKQSMGISPNEYLIYVRLTHAKQLLRSTNDPISEIAEEVGITNIGHFVELFKRYEDSTPGLYRRKWYRNEADDTDTI